MADLNELLEQRYKVTVAQLLADLDEMDPLVLSQSVLNGDPATFLAARQAWEELRGRLLGRGAWEGLIYEHEAFGVQLLQVQSNWSGSGAEAMAEGYQQYVEWLTEEGLKVSRNHYQILKFCNAHDALLNGWVSPNQFEENLAEQKRYAERNSAHIYDANIAELQDNYRILKITNISKYQTFLQESEKIAAELPDFKPLQMGISRTKRAR